MTSNKNRARRRRRTSHRHRSAPIASSRTGSSTTGGNTTGTGSTTDTYNFDNGQVVVITHSAHDLLRAELQSGYEISLLMDIVGTGNNGKIIVADVQQYVSDRAAD